MSKSSLSLLERFWLKVRVDPSGCWEWQGFRDKDRYGRFKRGDHVQRAPATAYEFAYGSIPEGMWALHKCDNPPCVRPSHLFLGTHEDNTRDCMVKGRNATGERVGGAKMTDQKVIAMRAQYDSGQFRFAHLARIYGVSQHTASRICRRLRWKHVA